MGGSSARAAIDAVAAVGGPTVFGLGFLALLFVLLTDSWAHSLITVAHECGHVVAAIVTFRGHTGIHMADGGGGHTSGVDRTWGPGDYLVTFVGCPAPSLIGLGGAALVAEGSTWGVLWIAVLLLIASFLVAANLLAGLVTLLILVVVGWTAVAGSPGVQIATPPGSPAGRCCRASCGTPCGYSSGWQRWWRGLVSWWPPPGEVGEHRVLRTRCSGNGSAAPLRSGGGAGL